jgi:hypothetical protein
MSWHYTSREPKETYPLLSFLHTIFTFFSLTIAITVFPFFIRPTSLLVGPAVS